MVLNSKSLSYHKRLKLQPKKTIICNRSFQSKMIRRFLYISMNRLKQILTWLKAS